MLKISSLLLCLHYDFYSLHRGEKKNFQLNKLLKSDMGFWRKILRLILYLLYRLLITCSISLYLRFFMCDMWSLLTYSSGTQTDTDTMREGTENRRVWKSGCRAHCGIFWRLATASFFWEELLLGLMVVCYWDGYIRSISPYLPDDCYAIYPEVLSLFCGVFSTVITLWSQESLLILLPL